MLRDFPNDFGKKRVRCPIWADFLNRHCYGLTYRSRKDGQKYRALYECQRIRRRLGASANMSEPFPPKPKGMRSDTYLKLRREHDRADREHARRTILELRILFRRV